MRKFVKWGMFAFLGVTMVTSFAGCKDDDPDYSNVTPPTVTASYSVSGRVTGMDGNGLVATVSLNGTTQQTNEDGTFLFENVAAGSYTLKAEAAGKQADSTTVTIAGNGGESNVVWNVALANEGTTIALNTEGATEGSVTSETMEGNENGAVTVDVNVPDESVSAGNSIIVTPLYDVDNAVAASRATSSTSEPVMLIGTNVQSTDPNATLLNPITLTYDLNNEVAQAIHVKKYENNQWVDASFTVEGSQVKVTADKFTSYILLLDAKVTTSTSSESLTFEKSTWDNLYGSSALTLDKAAFTYHVGTKIDSSNADKISAYLAEIVARLTGSSLQTAKGNYSLNITLPIGTALQITGKQQVTTTTVSALNHSVSGTEYGNMTFSVKTYNREHTGGSN